MKLIPPMKNLTLILWLFLVWVQALPLHAQNENNQHYYYIHGQAFNPSRASVCSMCLPNS